MDTSHEQHLRGERASGCRAPAPERAEIYAATPRLAPSTFDESGPRMRRHTAQKVVGLAPDLLLQHAAPRYGIVKEKFEVYLPAFSPYR